jgi:ubiquinone/menaquinone biosynthesis C-methylase UbiE
MNHFDEAAAGWDKNADHVRRARNVAKEIKKCVPLSKTWSSLEFGGGTGLLSFMLKSRLGRITLIDTSAEMVKIARRKLLKTKTRNMTVLKLDLLTEVHHSTYDFIYAMMSLHHINDIPKILGIFFSLLAPGGYVCVADLSDEHGSFHAQIPGFGGLHGFEPGRFKKQLAAAGFADITYKTVYTVKRAADNGHKKFPLFLMTGKKPQETGR